MPDQFSQGPIFCPFCHQSATLQWIYTPAQVAHLLQENIGFIGREMDKGRLHYRLTSKYGKKVRRVIDIFQLNDYVRHYKPDPREIEELASNPTLERIKAGLYNRRRGGQTTKELWKKRLIHKEVKYGERSVYSKPNSK